MAKPTGEFGCGAVGLSGFFGTQAAIEDELKKYQSAITFAVLTQTQKEAILAFEKLGGYCAAQCYNHGNTVGLYVRTRDKRGSGHNVKKGPKQKLRKKRLSFQQFWNSIKPHKKIRGSKAIVKAAWTVGRKQK